MHMKNKFRYTFLIDVFTLITLRDNLSNRRLESHC